MQISADLFAIYQSRNASTNKIIQMGLSLGLKAATMVHFVPALCPLFYVFIGYPTSDLWFTPYGMHEV